MQRGLPGLQGLPARPFAEETVNAGADCWTEMAFTDRNGALQTPLTLTWRLDDITNVQNIQAVTSLSPSGSTYELNIPASLNQMTRPNIASQLMQVTVVATFSDGSTDTQTAVYELIADLLPS